MAQPTNAVPDYELWYVHDFPVNAVGPYPNLNLEFQPALVEHIRQHGLKNPIIVRYRSEFNDARPVLMVGGNRWKAVITLGWDTIPAVVCGDRGREYPGARLLKWRVDVDPLFRDGRVTVFQSALAMERCSSIEIGEMPGPDSKLSYSEAISTTLKADGKCR